MTDSHAHELAAKLTQRERIANRANLLEMTTMPNGNTLGLCTSCPKKTSDSRRKGNRAFSSGFSAPTEAEIFDWFDAHCQTEMHGWYLSARWQKDALSAEEALLRSIFSPNQKTTKHKEPFKYAVRFR